MKVFHTDESHENIRVEAPVYRVNFWERPRPGYAWNLDAFVLLGCADVVQVILWARSASKGRRFQIFVGVEDTLDPQTLIVLYGEDPNRAPDA